MWDGGFNADWCNGRVGNSIIGGNVRPSPVREFAEVVCADHFEDVLIIEPEAWLATEEGQTPFFNEKGEKLESWRVHERGRVAQYTALHSKYDLPVYPINNLTRLKFSNH